MGARKLNKTYHTGVSPLKLVFSSKRHLEQNSFSLKKCINTYPYGFNGMERDDEVKGGGNSYTTPFRQYDPRLGRWLTIDPVKHHWESPYSGMYSSPINFADPLGLYGEKKAERKRKKAVKRYGEDRVGNVEKKGDGKRDWGFSIVNDADKNKYDSYATEADGTFEIKGAASTAITSDGKFREFHQKRYSFDTWKSLEDDLEYAEDEELLAQIKRADISKAFEDLQDHSQPYQIPEANSNIAKSLAVGGTLMEGAIKYTETITFKYKHNPAANFTSPHGESASYLRFSKNLSIVGGAYGMADNSIQAFNAYQRGDYQGAVRQGGHATGYGIGLGLMAVPGGQAAGAIIITVVGIFDYFDL